MIKKIVFLVISLIINLWFSVSIAITTGTVYLESSQDIIEEENEIYITVNLKDFKTAAFDFSLYFDNSKFEFVSDVENVNVIGNRIIYVWYDTSGGNGEKDGELAKFKFKAKENGLATFTIQGDFYSKNGQLIQTNYKEKQVQIGKENNLLQQSENEQGTNNQNENANLQSLRLDKEGITPFFEKDTYEYYLTVSSNVQNIDVLAISENPKATIEITGNTNIKEGLNLINISVIAEDKIHKNIYTINVTKTSNKELANTNLEVLAIQNVLLNRPFDINVTNYKAEVSNEIENLNIFAVPQNEEAKVDIIGKDNLKVGSNIAIITVTAPNGYTKKKYQIDIYRRNEDEEEKFIKEQEGQIEKIKKAYEIEENKNQIEENKNNFNNNKKSKFLIIGSLIVICLIGGCIYIFFKYKKVK